MARAQATGIRPGSGEAARPRRGAMLLIGLCCGALVTLATPSAVLLALLLAPGFAALLLDRATGKPAARAVMLLGLASAAHPLRALWRLGPSLSVALGLASDSQVLAQCWMAQAFAWLAVELLPVGIALALNAVAASRMARLAAVRRGCEERWDIPPAAPTDHP
ncbi:MAG: hypothetical protein KGL55_13835 [Rhodospirillales bacterium]|nr:hypothetical protein [Rhodospirillales bacterium]